MISVPLLLGALFLGLIPVTVSAEASIPTFQAEASVLVTFLPCDPTTGICPNTATGTGHATGLGAVVITASTFRVGRLAPCAPLYGTRTISSALGSIFLSSVGTGCLNDDGTVDADLNWRVTGGTGSFSNTSGS